LHQLSLAIAHRNVGRDGGKEAIAVQRMDDHSQPASLRVLKRLRKHRSNLSNLLRIPLFTEEGTGDIEVKVFSTNTEKPMLSVRPLDLSVSKRIALNGNGCRDRLAHTDAYENPCIPLLPTGRIRLGRISAQGPNLIVRIRILKQIRFYTPRVADRILKALSGPRGVKE